MDKIINERFKEMIFLGEFEAINELVLNSDDFDFSEEIISAAFGKPSLSFYTFMVSKLIEKIRAQRHEIAADLFSIPLCFYTGAYSVALFHARKALMLDPINLEHKTFLILFHDIPEKLISAHEANQIAIEILSIDPSVGVAQKVVKKYEKGIFFHNITDLPVSKISALLKDSIAKEMYLLLYYAKFEEARELVGNISLDDLFKIMTNISQKEPTLTMYGYVVSLLLEQETAALHQLASRVLVELLNSIEGAYVSAYWHATRAVELDPQSIVYKLWLLQFYDLPGQLLNKDDAIKLAREVVAIETDNAQALEMLEKIKTVI